MASPSTVTDRPQVASQKGHTRWTVRGSDMPCSSLRRMSRGAWQLYPGMVLEKCGSRKNPLPFGYLGPLSRLAGRSTATDAKAAYFIALLLTEVGRELSVLQHTDARATT